MEQTPILFSNILPETGSLDNACFNQKIPVSKCFQNTLKRAGSTQPRASCQAPNPIPSLHPKFSKIIMVTSIKKMVGGYLTFDYIHKQNVQMKQA